MGLLPDLFRETGRERLWKEQGGRGSGKSGTALLLPVVGGTGSLFIATWEVCCGLQEHCAISVTVSTNLQARSEPSLQRLCLAHIHRAKVTPRPAEVFPIPLMPKSPRE